MEPERKESITPENALDRKGKFWRLGKADLIRTGELR
jgi:hypothetical protein